MYQNEQTLQSTTEYDQIRAILPEHFCYLALDTTGFQADSSSVSVIGILYEEHGSLHAHQWLNDTGKDQDLILHDFCEFIKNHGFTHVITFYGNHFALPFLVKKSEEFASLLFMMCSTDLHDIVKPWKSLLALTSCRQKSLENFMHITRQSKLSGKGLVKAYQQLVGLSRPELSEHFSKENQSLRKELQEEILFHNKESLQILIQLSVVLVLDELKQGHLLNCAMKEPAIFTFSVNGFFPEHLQIEKDGIILKLYGSQCILQLPLWTSDQKSSYLLKHFLGNPKDYYYLIQEDRAVHKSLAAFVPKEYKKKATADTCYEWLSIDHAVFESEEGCARFAHDTILSMFSK